MINLSGSSVWMTRRANKVAFECDLMGGFHRCGLSPTIKDRREPSYASSLDARVACHGDSRASGHRAAVGNWAETRNASCLWMRQENVPWICRYFFIAHLGFFLFDVNQNFNARVQTNVVILTQTLPVWQRQKNRFDREYASSTIRTADQSGYGCT